MPLLGQLLLKVFLAVLDGEDGLLGEGELVLELVNVLLQGCDFRLFSDYGDVSLNNSLVNGFVVVR